jgi:pimeloyl-ACP methyl ester carboxylesterase
MAEPAGCQGNDIHRVTVPVDYNSPAGPTFDLAFRFRPGMIHNGPLVIVLPGGPGATLIREDVYVSSGGIPQSYGVVLTDPRGAGCNDDPALAEDHDFTSEWLARDTLRIVASLEESNGGVPLNYVLYGQSYGTLEATIVASLAPRDGVTPPKAVVLEGTLGHSFESYSDHFAPFQAEWRALRDDLPSKWRTAFQDGTFNPLLRASSRIWATLVDHDLIQGFLPNGEHVLELQLSNIGMLTRALRNLASSLDGDANATRSRLLRVIACTELTGDLYPSRDLRNGELVLAGQNVCGGGGIARRFDAANWPVNVPLVYFQGEHDPATPLSQARYHFETQRQSPRYFVRIDRAAHATLGVTLNVGDCREHLWDAVMGDLNKLAAAVAHCDDLEREAHVVLEYRPPEKSTARHCSVEVVEQSHTIPTR